MGDYNPPDPFSFGNTMNLIRLQKTDKEESKAECELYDSKLQKIKEDKDACRNSRSSTI